MRKENRLRKRIKQIPWVVCSCLATGSGIIIAYEAIALGLHILRSIHEEKLP